MTINFPILEQNFFIISNKLLKFCKAAIVRYISELLVELNYFDNFLDLINVQNCLFSF